MLLSSVGYVVIQESSARAVANLEVNVVGIALLLLTAVMLDRRDDARRAAAPALRIRREGSAAA